MPYKRTGKKTTTRKRYMRRKGAKRILKPTPTRGVASNPQNYQVINSNPKYTYYRFKDTFQLNDIVGTGVGIVGLNTFQIKQVARYTALVSMFRQYRIDSIKLRFTLNNVELTDNAILPKMYIKYNYDPDLVLGVMSEDYFLRQQNVICKQFHHNTINGSTLTYTLKPAVLVGTQLFNTTSFVPTPVYNRFVDFDPSGTLDEINHYGLQYVVVNLPSGVNINLDCEFQYTCRDVI